MKAIQCEDGRSFTTIRVWIFFAGSGGVWGSSIRRSEWRPLSCDSKWRRPWNLCFIPRSRFHSSPRKRNLRKLDSSQAVPSIETILCMFDQQFAWFFSVLQEPRCTDQNLFLAESPLIIWIFRSILIIPTILIILIFFSPSLQSVLLSNLVVKSLTNVQTWAVRKLSRWKASRADIEADLKADDRPCILNLDMVHTHKTFVMIFMSTWRTVIYSHAVVGFIVGNLYNS